MRAARRLLPTHSNRYTPRHAAPSEMATAGKLVLATGAAVAALPLTATAAQAGTVYSSSTTAHHGQASTALALSAPSHAEGSEVPVSVRLTAAGQGVRNGYVRLDRRTAQGWEYAGRLLTHPGGTASGTIPVTDSTDAVRAVYPGSKARTPAETAAEAVQVAVDRGQRVMNIASSRAGAPYSYGAEGPWAFDCSGFTRWVYSQLGISLPHSSYAQENMVTFVDPSNAQIGDLVFTNGGGHVGIYAGNGQIWHAPHSGDVVRLQAIWGSYRVGRLG